jgi:hypothetical protein
MKEGKKERKKEQKRKIEKERNRETEKEMSCLAGYAQAHYRFCVLNHWYMIGGFRHCVNEIYSILGPYVA